MKNKKIIGACIGSVAFLVFGLVAFWLMPEEKPQGDADFEYTAVLTYKEPEITPGYVKEDGTLEDGIYDIQCDYYDGNVIQNTLGRKLKMASFLNKEDRAKTLNNEETDVCYIVVANGKVGTIEGNATEEELVKKWKSLY